MRAAVSSICRSSAAAWGGTTTIIDFAVQTKGESMISGVDTWHKKAEGKCAIDYAFHLITTDFEDRHTERLFEARGHIRPLRIRPGYPVSQVRQQLRDPAHPDPADPDEMDPAGLPEHHGVERFHVPFTWPTPRPCRR